MSEAPGWGSTQMKTILRRSPLNGDQCRTVLLKVWIHAARHRHTAFLVLLGTAKAANRFTEDLIGVQTAQFLGQTVLKGAARQ